MIGTPTPVGTVMMVDACPRAVLGLAFAQIVSSNRIGLGLGKITEAGDSRRLAHGGPVYLKAGRSPISNLVTS